jgi:hypothetical protein
LGQKERAKKRGPKRYVSRIVNSRTGGQGPIPQAYLTTPRVLRPVHERRRRLTCALALGVDAARALVAGVRLAVGVGVAAVSGSARADLKSVLTSRV